MWLRNDGLLVWLAIVHTAFLLIPGLIVLSYGFIHHRETKVTTRPRAVIRTTRHAKVT